MVAIYLSSINLHNAVCPCPILGLLCRRGKSPICKIIMHTFSPLSPNERSNDYEIGFGEVNHREAPLVYHTPENHANGNLHKLHKLGQLLNHNGI
jgi:hypothetical protein